MQYRDWRALNILGTGAWASSAPWCYFLSNGRIISFSGETSLLCGQVGSWWELVNISLWQLRQWNQICFSFLKQSFSSDTLNLVIIFHQLTEKICTTFCKLVLPRLWVCGSQAVSWFQGNNLKSWKVFYGEIRLSCNRIPKFNQNQNRRKKCKHEMLLFLAVLIIMAYELQKWSTPSRLSPL